MKFGLFWMILWFANGCQSISVTENDDFVTVFRFSRNGYSPQVRTELHRQTNALGLPLRTRNGFFIDSVEGMPSLECSPAIKGCKWIQSNNWIYSNMNASDDKFLSVNVDEESFNLHGYYKTCGNYNGGCEMYCSMSTGYPVCACPNSMLIERSNMSCKERVDASMTSTSGAFSKQVYFSHSSQYYWFFIPPVNTTLHLNLQKEEKYHYLSATALRREESQESIFTDSRDKNVNIESEHTIKVTYENDGYGYSNSITASVHFRRSHLTLDGQQGTLRHEMIPITESLCVSVIYKSKSKSVSLNLHVGFENGTNIQASKFQDRQIGEWLQKRFYAELGEVSSAVRLSLEVKGQGTVIYSINGCSPYGNQDVSITDHNASPPVNIDSRAEVDGGGKCLHGGSLNEDSGKCVCPVGFRGPTCEEGCGPNSYGNDCSATCSDFNWGCLGMLFCKPHLPCLCAPGYTGEECDEECKDGTYGSHCLRVCGQCKNGVCDKFTGMCHSGCKSDSYPPYCVKKYKYLRDKPTVLFEELHTVYKSRILISFDPANVNGEGEIKYYQIQYYNMEASQDWLEMQPKKLNESSGIILDAMQGLSPGRQHILRVVFFDADGGSYQGPMVPETVFTTECAESNSREYDIIHNLTESGFGLRWQYALNETNCPITGYIVTLRRKWHQLEFNTSKTEIEFQNLLSGTEYEVKVNSQTKLMNNPSSSWYVVRTSDEAPSHVRNLKVIANGNKKMVVSWIQPKFTAGSLQKYVIRYKCTKYLACPSILKEGESEQMEVTVGANETSLTLEDLNNHAVYVIEVAGVTSNFTGPFTNIQSATDDAEPDVYPTKSENSVLSSTNTTITVQWLGSTECSSFNGYFMGYHYEVLLPNKTIIKEGQTNDTKITFTDLIPRTTFSVNVYILSSGGWNENKKITIRASTKATVPDKVENFTAYKRGRRQIGLRWSAPVNTFGEIKSFLVSYCEIPGDCEKEITLPTDPIPCSAWPNQFCYTIGNLRPNTKYSLSIRARNKEVDEYGSSVATTTVTSEGVPQAPIGLRIVKQDQQSVTLQWKPPLMYNGILRSFLVNVEHIDSANSSNCCTYFPLQEILVKSESEEFSFELLDLNPASKYTIGISSKTVSIGPSSTVTVNTPPEVPEFQPPRILDDSSVLIPKQNEYLGLTSKYLLVIFSENENSSEALCDKDVTQIIREVTNKFYVVDEYDNNALPVTVSLGSDEEPQNGTYCVIQNRPLPAMFRIGLGLVLDYNGSKNVRLVVV